MSVVTGRGRSHPKGFEHGELPGVFNRARAAPLAARQSQRRENRLEPKPDGDQFVARAAVELNHEPLGTRR